MINWFLYYTTDHIHNRLALEFDLNYCKVLCIQVIPTCLSQKLLRSEGYVSNMEIGTNIYFFLFFTCFLMSEELIDPGFMRHIGECAFWVIHQY